MEICKGFGDWFVCLKCPDICTKNCPIEKENAIEELMRQRMSLLERHNSQMELKEII
ncbi:MAG: hypothetical protein GW872_08630 [Nitrospirae bacterium]|nr:hypothetical protein [Nitrospirota bacterium]